MKNWTFWFLNARFRKIYKNCVSLIRKLRPKPDKGSKWVQNKVWKSRTLIFQYIYSKKCETKKVPFFNISITKIKFGFSSSLVLVEMKLVHLIIAFLDITSNYCKTSHFISNGVIFTMEQVILGFCISWGNQVIFGQVILLL